MNVLILGASSQLGRAVAVRFSSGNALTLQGRNAENLYETGRLCSDAGAAAVETIVVDLAEEGNTLMERLGGARFDLVVNLVASTSRVKDSEFSPENLAGYLMSDLLVPVRLVQALAERHMLKVIFVSTVLASVKSPDRALYGSLKALQELCLGKLVSGNGGLLVVQVGKVIPHDRASEEHVRLANAIYEAHVRNRAVLHYGLSGRIYRLLFLAQPMLFSAVVRLQRLLRERG